MLGSKVRIANLSLVVVALLVSVMFSPGCVNSQPLPPLPASVPTPPCTTYVVAAHDSVNKESADFRCDGIDDQVEIQAAIDTLPRPAHYDVEQSGGRIVLLDGNYHLTDSIKYRHYMALEGQGIRLTTLYNQTDGKYALEAQAHDDACFNLSLSGFSVYGVKGHEGGGIHLESIKNGAFTDIEVRRVKEAALWVDGGDSASWYNYFENIRCGRCGVGIRIDRSGKGIVNEFTLFGGNINANDKYNLEIQCGGGHKFIGTAFEVGDIYLDDTNDCNFISCRMEGVHFFNGKTAHDTLLVGGRRSGFKLTDENGSLSDFEDSYLRVSRISNYEFGSSEIIGDGFTSEFTISNSLGAQTYQILVTATNENMSSARYWISSKGEGGFHLTFVPPPAEGQLYTLDWMIHGQ